MRLIDLDKLLEALQITASKESCNGCQHASFHYFLCIDDLPLSEICKVIYEQPIIIVENEEETK